MKRKRILVFSPHPDDDAIGCGGTIRKHVIQGDIVRVIYVTSGEGGGHGRPLGETKSLREKEARNAAQILGISEVEFWGHPDGGLVVTRQLVTQLRTVIQEWEPNILYVTHNDEMHLDHQAAAKIVRNALSGPDAPVKKPLVYMFEVWTPLQRMDEVVDISPYLNVKIAAIQAHKSQCDVLSFDEAFLGLSRYRGELFSWPNGDYAEIFLRMRL